jgi:hypothetical protein
MQQALLVETNRQLTRKTSDDELLQLKLERRQQKAHKRTRM